MQNVISEMGPTGPMWRELAVPGAWEVSPPVHTDDRGAFVEVFTSDGFGAMTGHRFDTRQVNCSVSAVGALRGLHFAQVPPGQAKYITCARGSVFDVIVDIRIGSPTYARWDSVVLDAAKHRAVYLSEGLAHGFLALEDDSTLIYLCSTPYSPQREHTIAATDPAIGIEWPMPASELLLSDRDAAAPSLAEVRKAGLLPSWAETQTFIAGLPPA